MFTRMFSPLCFFVGGLFAVAICTCASLRSDRLKPFRGFLPRLAAPFFVSAAQVPKMDLKSRMERCPKGHLPNSWNLGHLESFTDQ